MSVITHQEKINALLAKAVELEARAKEIHHYDRRGHAALMNMSKGYLEEALEIEHSQEAKSAA